jgi:hypothetical protein
MNTNLYKKKTNPFFVNKEDQRKQKENKTKVLTLNKYMAIVPSGGPMPDVSVPAGCRQ